MRRYTSVISCCVSTCLNNTRNNDLITYFKLPAQRERYLKWVHLIDREDLAKTTSFGRVCEEHFDIQDIIFYETRKMLKRDAVPCLRLPIVASAHAKDENKKTANIVTWSRCDRSSQTEDLYLRKGSATASGCTTELPVTATCQQTDSKMLLIDSDGPVDQRGTKRKYLDNEDNLSKVKQETAAATDENQEDVAFAEFVASKIQKMDGTIKTRLQAQIQNLVYQAEMEMLLKAIKH